ncbi:MAG: glutamate ABC transporter substrate-binding protein [Euzebyales bacterium]|nr:glutamate ABC transporter substrate-binding protein [Euzebyales bacterium]
MTRYTRTLLALLSVLMLVVTACGGGEEPSASGGSEGAGGGEVPEFEEGTTMAEIQSEGTITIGTKFDQPLFGLANLEGVPEGFDVEMGKLVAAAIFGESTPENTEFTEAVSANREPFIQEGTVDIVIATYTINEERDEVIDFAGPYYIAGGEIMVMEGNPEGIEAVEDLDGQAVCTATGSTYVDSIAEQAPGAEVTTFDTYSECADAMTDGRVAAVATDNVILAGLVFQSDGAYELVGESFTEEPYGIGLEEGDTEFKEFLNGVITNSYESGEWERIYGDTIGQVIEEVPEPPPVEG